ncbi:MAG: DUF2842 domain-containing protein [Hyphomicrobium sp.]
MTVRSRKLLGTIGLLIFLTVYAFVAMMIAIILQVNASKTLELLYYLVAGLAWVFPAGLIIQWMLKT